MNAPKPERYGQSRAGKMAHRVADGSKLQEDAMGLNGPFKAVCGRTINAWWGWNERPTWKICPACDAKAEEISALGSKTTRATSRH